MIELPSDLKEKLVSKPIIRENIRRMMIGVHIKVEAALSLLSQATNIDAKEAATQMLLLFYDDVRRGLDDDFTFREIKEVVEARMNILQKCIDERTERTLEHIIMKQSAPTEMSHQRRTMHTVTPPSALDLWRRNDSGTVR
jgi:hypothetical protein